MAYLWHICLCIWHIVYCIYIIYNIYNITYINIYKYIFLIYIEREKETFDGLLREIINKNGTKGATK